MDLNCSNCEELLSKILCTIPLEWRKQIVSVICNELGANCMLNCDSVIEHETLTYLSDFKKVNNFIHITYIGEDKAPITRRFNIEQILNEVLNDIDPKCIMTVEEWGDLSYQEKIQSIISYDSSCRCCEEPTTTSTTTSSTTTTTTIPVTTTTSSTTSSTTTISSTTTTSTTTSSTTTTTTTTDGLIGNISVHGCIDPGTEITGVTFDGVAVTPVSNDFPVNTSSPTMHCFNYTRTTGTLIVTTNGGSFGKIKVYRDGVADASYMELSYVLGQTSYTFNMFDMEVRPSYDPAFYIFMDCSI